MAEFADQLNPETYNRVLEELLGQGVSRRVAEGRARRIAMVEYKKEHGEPAGAPTPTAEREAAAPGPGNVQSEQAPTPAPAPAAAAGPAA
ncbi:MAG TPA: hypothetical protein VHL78_14175, partial [Actinomycetota bacterium]|nr:hypothetical protein [Actinomycetota bacterium]